MILTFEQPQDGSPVPCVSITGAWQAAPSLWLFLGLVPKLSQEPLFAGAVLFGVSCHFCMDGFNGMALAEFLKLCSMSQGCYTDPGVQLSLLSHIWPVSSSC